MRKLALIAIAAGAAAISSPVLAQAGPYAPMAGPMPTPSAAATWNGGNWNGSAPNFPHHIQRGFVVPPMWLGPQFQVNNWQAYGFTPPPPQHRWVRYYNDAYM